MSTATESQQSRAASKDGGGKLLLAFVAGIVLVPGIVIGLYLVTVGKAASGKQNDNAGSNDSTGESANDGAESSPAPVVDSGPLQVLRLTTPLGDPDPFGRHWSNADMRVVPMLPQNVTMPAIQEVTVSQARVQAVTDGTDIAWRVSWQDPSPDAITDQDRFSDAVAVQFPVKPGSNVMMGLGGGKVQVLHWKALWQRDIEEGFQDVDDLHPNAFTGLYWFAEGERPWPIDQAFEDPRAQQWLVAYKAGNPLSDWKRATPAEELVAEGFGTLTTHAESATTASGVWSWDSWTVVFKRPLRTSDADDYQFPEQGESQVALAIWQGADKNVGGQKHWSNWVPFAIE